MKLRLAYTLLLAVVFLVVSFGQVRHTSSDPRGALWVSDAILTHGTIKLDHYDKNLLRH